MAQFEYNTTPRLSDFDESGEMRPEAFLQILENAGNLHSASVDDSVIDLKKRGHAWIVAAWDLKIYARPSEVEGIRVKTWFFSHTPSFMGVRSFIMENGRGEKLCEAEVRVALVNTETKRPEKLTGDYVALFGELIPPVFDPPLDRFIEPKEWENETEYLVRPSDLDMNGHVHNTRYATFACDVLSKKNVSSVRIVFRKELTAGKTVCRTFGNAVGLFQNDVLCAFAEIQ